MPPIEFDGMGKWTTSSYPSIQFWEFTESLIKESGDGYTLVPSHRFAGVNIAENLLKLKPEKVLFAGP
jgi:hypothetical protein